MHAIHWSSEGPTKCKRLQTYEERTWGGRLASRPDIGPQCCGLCYIATSLMGKLMRKLNCTNVYKWHIDIVEWALGAWEIVARRGRSIVWKMAVEGNGQRQWNRQLAGVWHVFLLEPLLWLGEICSHSELKNLNFLPMVCPCMSCRWSRLDTQVAVHAGQKHSTSLKVSFLQTFRVSW